MRISDWSSDVCSSDLNTADDDAGHALRLRRRGRAIVRRAARTHTARELRPRTCEDRKAGAGRGRALRPRRGLRSEAHTSELQPLMRIPYAVFCLKNKPPNTRSTTNYPTPLSPHP